MKTVKVKNSQSYYLKEKLKNLLELKEMIKSESLPSGFVYVKKVAAFFTIISKVLISHWIHRNFLVQLL